MYYVQFSNKCTGDFYDCMLYRYKLTCVLFCCIMLVTSEGDAPKVKYK